ncbi:TPA: hypothetical protein ACN6ZQ_004526 [Escherichia albertii]|uniref:hypothetical protein n=1 Tax=Escherichia albertii TaxID=208962 RepID=UPI00359C2102
MLEFNVRQVQRLVRLYRTDGATAFASSRRGRPANNRINEEIRCKTLDLISVSWDLPVWSASAGESPATIS